MDPSPVAPWQSPRPAVASGERSDESEARAEVSGQHSNYGRSRHGEPSQTNSGQHGDAATAYVDGFVIAVPRDRIDEYERIARDAAAVWREHGALGVAECVADDVTYGELTSFPRAGPGEPRRNGGLLVDRLRAREARDEVNAKVMADPRIKQAMAEVPFDPNRMMYGGSGR